MKNVLIVDDEKNIRVTLSEWFRSFVEDFHPFVAEDGQVAAKILKSEKFDLVITDLNMPEMDGFELLAHINNNYPSLPVIVMTAFGTEQVRDKVDELGAIKFLDKPLDFDYLKEFDFHESVTPREQSPDFPREESSVAKNYVNGISLTSFLQLIDMEKKTCTLSIKTAENKKGFLYLVNGDLVDAEAGSLSGEKAAYEMICWDNVLIEIDNECKRREKNIDFTTMHLLMEGCRIKDEQKEQEVEGKSAKSETPGPEEAEEHAPASMTINEQQRTVSMEELAAIDGFSGAVLVSPEGETIHALEAKNNVLDLTQVGALANTVLVNAKKAALDFGSGNAKFVHIEAENHHILGRCLNESDNAMITESGKKHVHLIVILTNGNSLGVAKVMMQKVISTFA